eukprot:jgi/Astpho2/7719/Aster-x1444
MGLEASWLVCIPAQVPPGQCLLGKTSLGLGEHARANNRRICMSYELHGPFGVTLLRPSCEIILGRSRKGTARLDDPYASGQHLKLGRKAILAPGSRFYIFSRADTTMCTLSALPGSPQTAATVKPALTGKRSAAVLELGAGPSTSVPAEDRSMAKRAKVEQANHGSLAQSAASSQSSGPGIGFRLLKVDRIPEWANRAPVAVRLQDVVCGEIKVVLASNFQVDLGWQMNAVAAATRLKDDAVLHAPDTGNEWGKHHSKFFLLQYETGLRFILLTANLHHPDCCNKSQGLHFQDFPQKDAESPPSSDFEQQLLIYVKALKLPGTIGADVLAMIIRHDLSSARGAAKLLHGHMRIRELLQRERFSRTFERAELLAQFSSLGSLNDKWLHEEFVGSLSAGKCPGAPPRPGTLEAGLLGSPRAEKAGLHLVWPTVQEVRDSVEGYAAGGSIPGTVANVTKPFLQSLWRRWGGEVMGRQRAMPHMKSYLRFSGKELAWVVLTSSNLSIAAWGKLEKKTRAEHEGSQLYILA